MTRALVAVLTITLASCATTMTSPTPAADTELLLREFSSTVIPGGSASRTFDTTAAGSISVVLKSTTPGGVAVGLCVGIPRSNGSCAVSSAIEAVAGAAAQIAVAADKGAYCTKVYDLGTLTAPLSFTIAISYP